MKLLIATGIYPPEIGGPAGYVRGLATELVRRGHSVTVVTYGTEETEKLHKADGRGFGLTVIPRTFGPLVRYCRYALAVRRLARTSDLVYLQGPVSEGFPGMIGTLLAGKKAVLKIVGDYAWEQYQQTSVKKPELLDEFLTHRHGGEIRIFEFLERWTAKRAKKIIVPSKYLKSVVEKWGITPEKIEVIYNSIEPLPNPTQPPLRPRGGEEGLNGKKIILTVVRAVPWKGGDFLCDCLKELPTDYVLVVAGDGPSLEPWKRHADRIGVSNRVLWLGRLSKPEVANWYRTADVFALATGYEGFPHVVVEACSTGLPCIVSDRGGNPETKEFYPALVTVALYGDMRAWVNAFKQVGGRQNPVNSELGLVRMIDQTVDILATNI